jgi:hypothetical protein
MFDQSENPQKVENTYEPTNTKLQHEKPQLINPLIPSRPHPLEVVIEYNNRLYGTQNMWSKKGSERRSQKGKWSLVV